MIGAWCFGCCQAHRNLPVRFLLIRFSVLFTVESLSLLYILFISWFICSRRWCFDKLGVFHANQTTLCLDPHLNLGWGWCTVKIVSEYDQEIPQSQTADNPMAPRGRVTHRFKPSRKIFLLTVPGRCFFCGSFMLFLSCFVMRSCTSICWCVVVTFWKGLFSWLSFVMCGC